MDYDIRSKNNAEYICTECGYKHWVNNIQFPSKYDTTQILKCPKCGCFGKEDQKLNLIKKHKTLLEEEKRIHNEIEKIISEIGVLEKV
jgi:ribosomal protein L37AE/L43A